MYTKIRIQNGIQGREPNQVELFCLLFAENYRNTKIRHFFGSKHFECQEKNDVAFWHLLFLYIQFLYRIFRKDFDDL